jgi:hypothetical protein
MNEEQRKREDRLYYLARMSHRLAVRTLLAIQEELGRYGTVSWGSPDEWDYTVPNMISQIRRIRKDAQKYHELRNVLQKTVK